MTNTSFSPLECKDYQSKHKVKNTQRISIIIILEKVIKFNNDALLILWTVDTSFDIINGLFHKTLVD